MSRRLAPSPALRVLAGPAARRRLAQTDGRVLASDVRIIPAAAGGPKGLVLGPLDRWLFGHWLPQGGQTVHLLGASIGAWRMAAACMPDPQAALGRLTEDYITQDYDHAPGQAPRPEHVSAVFGAKLRAHFGGHEADILRHPWLRLHVFTSHGRGLLAREGRWRTPLGYGAAFVSNAVHRPALGLWLERMVFSDTRQPLPIALDDFRTQVVALSAHNLLDAVLASCSIPFWLRAVHDIAGAPPGAHWDGGITDYHLHLRYDTLPDGLVLYPHFQDTVVPGWLDKLLRWRHPASPALDSLVLLAPHPDWVARLPGGKLPDRRDFQSYVDDPASRQRRWREAVAASEQLAQEFADWVEGRGTVTVEPLP